MILRGALMEARYNAIIAAKPHFFTLKEIYPDVSAKIKTFATADKATKAELLPPIRQQVETWLTNFSLLLDTDQKILAAQNMQIAKIAAQMKITAAKKIQTIPPTYASARDAFLAAYNGLNHRNIAALNATAAEIETINNLISQENPNNPGIIRTIGTINEDSTILQADKDDMGVDVRGVRFSTYFSKLKDYRNLLNNNPFAAISDNGASQAAYANLSNAVVDSELVLTQALATAEARLRANTNNNTFQVQVNVLREKLTVLKEYKNNLLKCAAATIIVVTNDNQSPADGGDGFIRRIVLPNGTQGVELMINATSLNALPADQRQNVRDRTIAHEMQHAIQFKAGRLGYRTDTDNPTPLLYDINDEVEAFKVEYAVYGLDPRNRRVDIQDMTIPNLTPLYPALSQVNLSLNSTLAQINAAGGDTAIELGNVIIELQNANVRINADIEPDSAININIVNPNSNAAEPADNMTLQNFFRRVIGLYGTNSLRNFNASYYINLALI